MVSPDRQSSSAEPPDQRISPGSYPWLFQVFHWAPSAFSPGIKSTEPKMNSRLSKCLHYLTILVDNQSLSSLPLVCPHTSSLWHTFLCKADGNDHPLWEWKEQTEVDLKQKLFRTCFVEIGVNSLCCIFKIKLFIFILEGTSERRQRWAVLLNCANLLLLLTWTGESGTTAPLLGLYSLLRLWTQRPPALTLCVWGSVQSVRDFKFLINLRILTAWFVGIKWRHLVTQKLNLQFKLGVQDFLKRSCVTFKLLPKLT